MKTKNTIRIIALLLAVMVFTLTTGCKKDNEVEPNQTDTSSLQQLTSDQRLAESSNDDVLNDINDILTEASEKNLTALPCNVELDTTITVGDTITYYIVFNGANCANTLTRYGNATVKKNTNTPWNQAGTKIIVNYINIVITKVATGKSVTLNGTHTFENITGGYLSDLGTSYTSISHKITGQLELKFEDNTTRAWHVNRQRTFSGTLGDLTLTNIGLGASNVYSNLAWWGTNRHGEQFYTEILQDVVHKQACNWNPVSGVIIHRIPAANKSATITFGYDINNQPISSGNCPVKLKLDWTKDNQSGTIFITLP